MLAKAFSVFALAMIELWAAVPLGIKLDLDPYLVGAVTMAGAFAGAALATFAGGAVHKLLNWRSRGKDFSKGTSGWLASKGPWAIGLLGPILLGATLSAALASSLGLAWQRWMPLLAIGICATTALVTILTVRGFAMMH
ncbi:hypothetical protein ASD15_22055 [Massilia sp. Root351]|uniref:hypothetical protein n=1 Tax=Massilia sp. Root351 TaxID=1736522 RepID=UPI00070CB599|nr:hypothetical protein [Massilia sp. Root351]KQV78498.1 hypothetical protein ASD15_22055 [Massilia sp. Root351]